MPRINFKPDPPIFPGNTVPFGRVPRDSGGQCLFYYWILATQLLAKLDHDLPLEDDPVRRYRFQQLYLKLCKLYNVDPNECVNYWPAIEEEIRRMNYKRLDAAMREGTGTETTTYKQLPDKFKYPLQEADEVRQ